MKTLHQITIAFWKFTTYTLYFTMEEEFKKELTTLWERGGAKFNHFEFVTQEQCNKLIEDTPKKYEKK